MERIVEDSLALESSSPRDSLTWLLWVALASIALGAIALSGGIVLHFIGYLLASVVSFTLIAMFRRRSLERTASAGIGVPRWINIAAFAGLLAGFVVSVAQAWLIASYLS